MDPLVRERAFEPFFTTKGPARGSGLGLSTVYGIVRQFGGRLDLSSTLGVGTRVEMRFPDAPLDTPARRAQPVSTRPRPEQTSHVLVVEDDDAVAQVVQACLEGHGYQVTAFQSALLALEGLPRLGRIDLLLTDLVMPKMDGHELARRVAEQRPELPVLYMSGYTDDRLPPEALAKTGVRFLAKPFTVSALLEAVHLATASRARASEA
jgi:CheY-like chemotaxis protein